MSGIMQNFQETIISAPDRWGRRLSIVLLPDRTYGITLNGHMLSDQIWTASEREIEDCARTLLRLTEAHENRRRAIENPAYRN
jgi:hypothetical protein